MNRLTTSASPPLVPSSTRSDEAPVDHPLAGGDGVRAGSAAGFGRELLACPSLLAGVALALVYFLGERWGVAFGRIAPMQFATRARAAMNVPLAAAALFAAFAGLHALTVAGWQRRSEAIRASWPFRIAVALWALYPLVWVAPQLLNGRPLFPASYVARMAQYGLDPRNRLATVAAGGLYLAVLGLCAWGVFRALLRRSRTDARPVGPVLFLLAAGLIGFAGIWTTAEYPPTGDEPHYLLMAHSLLHDHDLDLTNNFARRDYLSFRDRLEPQVGRESGRTANHEILFPVLIAPAYALGGRLGVVLFQNLLAALAVWLIFGVAERRLGSAPAALVAVGCAAFLTPFLTYGSQIFPEVPAALLVATALRLAATDRPRLATVAGLGAVVVALPMLKVRFALLSASLLLLGAARVARSWRARLTLAGALAAGLAGLFLLDHAFLGGYVYWGKFTWAIHGLVHIWPARQYGAFLLAGLFDSGSGLLVFAPLLLVGFAGLSAGLRRDWRGAALLAQVALFYYVIKAPYWQAGWCPAGRYWIALIPVVTPFLGAGLQALGAVPRFPSHSSERRFGGLGFAVAWALGAVSACWVFVTTLIPALRYPATDSGGNMLLSVVASGTGRPLPHWLSGLTTGSDAPGLAWLAVACVLVFLWAGLRERENG